MSAEPHSASLVSRLVVPGKRQIPQGYYRSKLFISSSTSNPLVSAAGPLLSLLERLCISPTLPPIESIRDNIDHELHAFHSRLIGQQYADEFVVIACYLLSATIDELLGKNYLRLYGQPATFTAFTPPSHDDIGPQQRFFNIVNHIKERTNQYLDLIELAYYCLITGFEGEHHLRADGRQLLDNLIEELYQLILQNRANKPHRLFKIQPYSTTEATHHRPILIATLLTVCAILSIYFITEVAIESKAKTVLMNYPMLAKLEHR